MALSALRSLENPSATTRMLCMGIEYADRVTVKGHIVGGVIIAAVPVAAEYAYAHPLTGLVGACLFLTGTMRRAVHRIAGVCLKPAH